MLDYRKIITLNFTTVFDVYTKAEIIMSTMASQELKAQQRRSEIRLTGAIRFFAQRSKCFYIFINFIS